MMDTILTQCIDHLFNNITQNIQQLCDISVDESAFLFRVIPKCYFLDDLVKDESRASTRLRELRDILDMKLIDIMHRFRDGLFLGLSGREIGRIVRSLFSESRNRVIVLEVLDGIVVDYSQPIAVFYHYQLSY